MASSGSLLPQYKTDSHQHDLKDAPSVTSTMVKTRTTSVHPPVASRRVDGSSVHHNRASFPDARKSFFQKYVPDDIVQEGEGGDGKDGGENCGARILLSSPRRSPRSNRFDSSSHTKRSTNSLHPFWLKGLIVNKDRNKDSAEFWIENPIHCGYLHAYCLDERNIENIKFLMAVDAFKDELRGDVGVWQSMNYQHVDTIMEIHKHVKPFDLDQQELDMNWSEHISQDRWPSVRLSYQAIVAHIQKIWDTFLSAKAPLQICANATIMGNMIFRLSRLDAYGIEIFEELCIDPLITIKRDVLPRFFNSIWFKKLSERLKTVEVLPQGSTFTVRPPRKNACLSLDIDAVFLDDLKVPMDVLIHDGIYYAAFMQYLESIVASELLLCARAFSTYHCFWLDHKGTLLGPNDTVPGADDAAWKIFRFFVAVGSAFEVSVSAKTRKSIMLHLAVPKKDMFNALEKGTNKALTHHLTRFFSTTYFLSIPDTIRARQEERKEKQQKQQQQLRQATKVGHGTPTIAAMLMGAVGGTSSSSKQAHLFRGKTDSFLEKEKNQPGLRIYVQMILTGGFMGRGKTTPEMEELRPPPGIGGRRRSSIQPAAALFGGTNGVVPAGATGVPPAVSNQSTTVEQKQSTCLIS